MTNNKPAPLGGTGEHEPHVVTATRQGGTSPRGHRLRPPRVIPITNSVKVWAEEHELYRGNPALGETPACLGRSSWNNQHEVPEVDSTILGEDLVSVGIAE